MAIPCSLPLTCRRVQIEKRTVKDRLFDRILLCSMAIAILGTPEFLRLERISQLGGTPFVFPEANHSRLEHSIGVYHLANRLVRTLRRKFPHLAIDADDERCVAIAGLCHDLGMSCFILSHFRIGDEEMQSEMRGGSASLLRLPHLQHEEMSVELFDSIVERRLKALQLRENDVIFIKECIWPPKHSQYKGRPKEKAFLYDIVNNAVHGVDVDKAEYMLRDAMYLSASIPFTKDGLDRLIESVYVDADSNGRASIFYDKKEMANIGISRMILHDQFYKHPDVLAYQHLIIEVIGKAAPYLDVYSENKKHKCKLINVYKHPSIYSNLNDGLLQLIANSTRKELEPARFLAQQLFRREIPRFVGEGDVPISIPDDWVEEWIANELIRLSDDTLKQDELIVTVSAILVDDVRVEIRDLHPGKPGGWKNGGKRNFFLYVPFGSSESKFEMASRALSNFVSRSRPGEGC